MSECPVKCEDSRSRHSGGIQRQLSIQPQWVFHSPATELQNPTDYIHNLDGPTYQHANMQKANFLNTFNTDLYFCPYFQPLSSLDNVSSFCHSELLFIPPLILSRANKMMNKDVEAVMTAIGI